MTGKPWTAGSHSLEVHNGHGHDELHGLRLHQAACSIVPASPLQEHALDVHAVTWRCCDLGLVQVDDSKLKGQCVDGGLAAACLGLQHCCEEACRQGTQR